MFGVYVLTRLVQDKVTVLYRYRSQYMFFCFDPARCQYYGVPPDLDGNFFGFYENKAEAADILRKALVDPDLWHLVDLHTETYVVDTQFYGFVAIFSSPSTEKYKSLVDGGTGQTTAAKFFMPPWSKEELVKFHDQLKIPGDVEARFNIHGGSARILMRQEVDSEKDLRNVLFNTSAEDFKKALNPECGIKHLSGRLVHVYPNNENEFDLGGKCFPSPYIMGQVASRFIRDERFNITAWLKASEGMSGINSPRGVYFEQLCHQILREGGSGFKMRTLEKMNEKLKDISLPMCSDTLLFRREDLSDVITVKLGIYGNPTIPTFGTLDSWALYADNFIEGTIRERILVLYQMTVAKDHKKKGKYAVNVIKRLQSILGDPKLKCFMVYIPEDPEKFGKQGFTKDDGKDYTSKPVELQSIQEYALSVPRLLELVKSV
jgi:hypothetical protein